MSEQDLIRRLVALERRVLDLETQERVPIAARYSGNSEAVTGTAGALALTTSEHDTWSACTSSPWEFTAPVGGYYVVSAALQLASSAAWTAGERAYLYVYKNGSPHKILATWQAHATVTLAAWLGGLAKIHLDEDDTVKIYAEQDSGSSINTADDTYVDVWRVTP
jgi:hypothetical protein